MKTNDQNVIISAMEGKEEAFNELYQRYYKLAYFIAYKVCCNEADAQDATQEAFIAIKDNISKLQNPDAFKGWMSKIVVTKCKRLFRKNARVNRYTEKLNQDEFIFEQRKEFVPTKNLRFKNDEKVLNSLLEELSPEQRLMIVLFYFQQLSLNEIVEITDVPLGTVKSRLSYARKTLYHKIQEYEQANDEKLSFHGFDMLLLSFFVTSFSKFTVPKMILPIKLKKHRILQNPTSVMAIASTSVVAVAGVCTAVIAMSNPSPVQKDVTQNSYQSSDKFQTVAIGDEQIENAKDAYFSLILWAYDKDELLQKTSNEISTYTSVYEELKRYGGTYYQLLQNRDWSVTFEDIKL